MKKWLKKLTGEDDLGFNLDPIDDDISNLFDEIDSEEEEENDYDISASSGNSYDVEDEDDEWLDDEDDDDDLDDMLSDMLEDDISGMNERNSRIVELKSKQDELKRKLGM